MINKQAFIELLQSGTHKAGSQEIKDLEEVLKSYPYFHSAQILLAKLSIEEGYVFSSNNTKKAAAYTTDRSLLKRYLHPLNSEKTSLLQPEKVIEKPILTNEAISELEISHPTNLEIEKSVELKEEVSLTLDTPSLNDFELNSELETTHQASVVIEAPTELQEDIIATLEALKAARISQTSLVDNVQVKSVEEERLIDIKELSAPEVIQEKRPIESKTEPEKLAKVKKNSPKESKANNQQIRKVYVHNAGFGGRTKEVNGDALDALLHNGKQTKKSTHTPTKNKVSEIIPDYPIEEIKIETDVLAQNELISKFIAASNDLEKIVVRADTPSEDLSKKSTLLEDNIASETLANLFAKQGKYKKAIAVFRKLSLVYPEKKTYFASRIEELKKNK